jgi:hypothetical protein
LGIHISKIVCSADIYFLCPVIQHFAPREELASQDVTYFIFTHSIESVNNLTFDAELVPKVSRGFRKYEKTLIYSTYLK